LVFYSSTISNNVRENQLTCSDTEIGKIDTHTTQLSIRESCLQGKVKKERKGKVKELGNTGIECGTIEGKNEEGGR